MASKTQLVLPTLCLFLAIMVYVLDSVPQHIFSQDFWNQVVSIQETKAKLSHFQWI